MIVSFVAFSVILTLFVTAMIAQVQYLRKYREVHPVLNPVSSVLGLALGVSIYQAFLK